MNVCFVDLLDKVVLVTLFVTQKRLWNNSYDIVFLDLSLNNNKDIKILLNTYHSRRHIEKWRLIKKLSVSPTSFTMK